MEQMIPVLLCKEDPEELNLQDMLTRAGSVTGEERDDRCYETMAERGEKQYIWVSIIQPGLCN